MTKWKHSHLGKEVLFIYSFPGYIADVGASEDTGIPQCKCKITVVIY